MPIKTDSGRSLINKHPGFIKIGMQEELSCSQLCLPHLRKRLQKRDQLALLFDLPPAKSALYTSAHPSIHKQPVLSHNMFCLLICWLRTGTPACGAKHSTLTVRLVQIGVNALVPQVKRWLPPTRSTRIQFWHSSCHTKKKEYVQ